MIKQKSLKFTYVLCEFSIQNKMDNNKQTFWDMKKFLINFTMIKEGEDKQKIRDSERYENALEKAYNIFAPYQRKAIYQDSFGELEKELNILGGKI